MLVPERFDPEGEEFTVDTIGGECPPGAEEVGESFDPAGEDDFHVTEDGPGGPIVEFPDEDEEV